MPLRLVSWNIAHRVEPWRWLARMQDVDVALLQEAGTPPSDVALEVHSPPLPGGSEAAAQPSSWRTAIARLSARVTVTPWTECALGAQAPRALAVSWPGSLAAADLTFDGETITIVSAYAQWERPHPDVRSEWIYADGSAHRLVSDIAALVGRQSNSRIIVAGDFNLLRGYGEHGSEYWARRYATVFERMDALGLHFAGPESPNGRSAEPVPDELPEGSTCVPTFHGNRDSPATATRQLDFVFASTALHKRLSVRALNGVSPDEWGPSDHCRVVIDVR